MKTYIFNDGHKITSKLSADEVIKRMNRLDWLRVMTEGFEEGEGKNICDKALKAYNKTDNFTGIIRLNLLEKDFLDSMLENSCITQKDIDIISFYLK